MPDYTKNGVPALLVHDRVMRSRANGPGVRAVVWVQGCSLGCPGCFNPGTHDEKQQGTLIRSDEMLAWLRNANMPGIPGIIPGLEGITVSGGEPFQQPTGLFHLLYDARILGLSTVVFTGYTLSEIDALPSGGAALRLTDVLIAGRYAAGLQRSDTGLAGLPGKRVHLLAGRYTMDDLRDVPTTEVQVLGGDVVSTGVIPLPI